MDVKGTCGERSGDGVTRRQLISAGATGALAVSGASVLAACGGGASSKGSSSTTSTTSAGAPVHGGTFNVGMITGGTAETLNPNNVIANVDILRARQLFETLFNPSPDITNLVPALALSSEPNKAATQFTIHLRDGVVWHNGKQFSADDVVWSFQAWSSPGNFVNSIFAGIVDFKGVKKINRLTVQIPLLLPMAEFPSLLSFDTPYIIQNGTTRKEVSTKPIGTGPFKFVSFTPGKQSVFAANKEYWEHGKPYVDEVIINSSFTDETARLNALLSGEINVSSILPPLTATTLKNSTQAKLLFSPSSDGYVVLMRVDKGPFADVRIRQALKMLADRQALVDGALAGFGTVGNDLPGQGCRYFANLPPIPRDLEKAKSLLKAAGAEGRTFSLPTSSAGAGFVEAATLYAQQVAAGGVKANVDQIPAESYYTSASGFLTRPICMDNGYASQSLTQAYITGLTKTAPYNETHWCSQQPGGDAANKLIFEAIGTLDPAKASELWHEVQLQQYNEGGQLLYANAGNLDACAPNIQGLRSSPAGNLNIGRLLDGWIAKA